MITIRKAKTSDAEVLSDLFVEFMGTSSDTEKMKTVLDQIEQNPQYYIPVACDGEKVVGVAMGIVCFDICGTCEPFMLVEDVVVAPDYRGMGIGRQIMQSIENFGRENKCKYVILVSEAKRTDSHKFYDSIGYPSGKEMGFKKRLDS